MLNFLQTLSSVVAGCVLAGPPVPSSSSCYATVAALLSTSPPPSFLDRIRALAAGLLGGSARDATSRMDLFLHAVMLATALVAVLHLNEYSSGRRGGEGAKVATHSPPTSRRSNPEMSQEAETRILEVKEKIDTEDVILQRERRDEWCNQIYASVLNGEGARKKEADARARTKKEQAKRMKADVVERMETEARIENELEGVMENPSSHQKSWLNYKSKVDVPTESLLLLALSLATSQAAARACRPSLMGRRARGSCRQSQSAARLDNQRFDPDLAATGVEEIPEHSEDIEDLEEEEARDIPDIMYVSDGTDISAITESSSFTGASDESDLSNGNDIPSVLDEDVPDTSDIPDIPDIIEPWVDGSNHPIGV